MNTRSVFKSARRNPGITLTLTLLLLTLRPAKGADIIATATGIIQGGWDSANFYKVGPLIKTPAFGT